MLKEFQRLRKLAEFSTSNQLIFPRVLDFGINQDIAYYIMERIPGVIKITYFQ